MNSLGFGKRIGEVENEFKIDELKRVNNFSCFEKAKIE